MNRQELNKSDYFWSDGSSYTDFYRLELNNSDYFWSDGSNYTNFDRLESNNSDIFLTDDTTYNLYDYYFKTEEKFFDTILMWFEVVCLVPIGVCGNLLVIVIMLKKKYQNSSTAVFFFSLAIADITTLLTTLYAGCIIHYTWQYMDSDCRVHMFLGYTSVQLSASFLAVIAMQRAVSIVYPHKARFLFTARNARIIVCAIAVLISSVNASLIAHLDNTTIDCQQAGHLEGILVYVFTWIDLLVSFVIPFVIIVVCSIIAVVKLRPKNTTSSKTGGKYSSLTKMVLATNACFLMTMSPFVIYQIAFVDISKTDLGLLFLVISEVNSAVNFVLYFLNARIFRADVRKLLCKNS